MIIQRSLRGVLIFILCAVGLLPAAHGQQYIESTVWSARVANLTQNQLVLDVQLNNGPGSYNYNVFYSDCSGGGGQPTHSTSYVIAPKTVSINGVSIPIAWSGNRLAELDGWVILGSNFLQQITCRNVGYSGAWTLQQTVNAQGSGDLRTLPPGEYSFSMTYYVGNSFGTSYADTLNLIKNHGLEGAASSTPVTPFTGVAACAQDSPTAGETIDFGTVTSNGTVQPGPLTTLGLVCNYDVALNDVTYSLTSNNPVTGEPSTGQNVAVALTNGATVKLDGGNVTQPDPKKVSVNITPSIDTRGATAGEGTGSATLTFTYE